MFDMKCFLLFTTKQYSFAMKIDQRFPNTGTFTHKLPSIKTKRFNISNHKRKKNNYGHLERNLENNYNQ